MTCVWKKRCRRNFKLLPSGCGLNKGVEFANDMAVTAIAFMENCMQRWHWDIKKSAEAIITNDFLIRYQYYKIDSAFWF